MSGPTQVSPRFLRTYLSSQAPSNSNRGTRAKRPWPWPWCGGWWMHQWLRHRSFDDAFETIPCFAEACRRGEVGSVLVDSQTLMFCLDFKSVVFDAAAAEGALRHFLSHFKRVKLLFAFPVAGPNDGQDHRGLGLGGEPEHYQRFDGIEPEGEHEQVQLQQMASYRAKRDMLDTGIVMSGHDTTFFREWFTRRVAELGHEVLHVEGINDHYQQLALLARERKVDFVLSTYPDFYMFDMGMKTGFIQLRTPYPLGFGGGKATVVHTARDVARVLGVPLGGLHELSCLLGNHLLRPSGEEPLARFLDGIQKELGLDKQGVVQYCVDMVRTRWTTTNGRHHTVKQRVQFLHDQTGIDMKMLQNALEFYRMDNKRVNSVWSASFPLLKKPKASKKLTTHAQYLNVVQFKETRLAVQFGDAFIRRHAILQPLRAFKYGLLMMNSEECNDVEIGLDDDYPEVILSKEHFVNEHRADYASRAQNGDSVSEFEVQAALPAFEFASDDEQNTLSKRPLYKALADVKSVEHKKRKEFYLTLFGANNAQVQVLPPKLIPIAAALRFLARRDIIGMGKAIETFIDHVAILQTGDRERVTYNSRRFMTRRKSGGIPQKPDERQFALFFVIVQAVYKAMVELNELCGMPYPQEACIERILDWNVYMAVRAHGMQLSKEEIPLASSLRKAVMQNPVADTKVDTAPHESVWIPANVPHGLSPGRKMSAPVLSPSKMSPMRKERAFSMSQVDKVQVSPDFTRRWSMLGATRINLSPRRLGQQPLHTPPARRSSVGFAQGGNAAPNSAPPRRRVQPRRLFGSNKFDLRSPNKNLSPTRVGTVDPTAGGWWRAKAKSDTSMVPRPVRLDEMYGPPAEQRLPIQPPTVPLHVAMGVPPQQYASQVTAPLFPAPPQQFVATRHPVPMQSPGEPQLNPALFDPQEQVEGKQVHRDSLPQAQGEIAPARKSSVLLTFGPTDDFGRERSDSFKAEITDMAISGRSRSGSQGSQQPPKKPQHSRFMSVDMRKMQSPGRFGTANSSPKRFGGAAAQHRS